MENEGALVLHQLSAACVGAPREKQVQSAYLLRLPITPTGRRALIGSGQKFLVDAQHIYTLHSSVQCMAASEDGNIIPYFPPPHYIQCTVVSTLR